MMKLEELMVYQMSMELVKKYGKLLYPGIISQKTLLGSNL